MSVGTRLSHDFRTDDAIDGGAIINNHGLTQYAGQPLRDEPGGGIESPARRKRGNQPHRPGWKDIRGGRSERKRQTGPK
jgi:hypothetical protein